MKKELIIAALIFIVGVVVGFLWHGGLSSSAEEKKPLDPRGLEAALDKKSAEAFYTNQELEKTKRHLRKAQEDLGLAEKFLKPETELKGSPIAINFEKYMAQKERLTIIKNKAAAEKMKKSWILEKLNAGDHVKIDQTELKIENAYCLHRVNLFLKDLGDAFYKEFQKDIFVTSMLRDSTYHEKERKRNGNATKGSPHQTGAAIDLKKGELHGKRTRGYSPKEMKWLREYFLKYERAGLIQVTEEYIKPNTHIMILGHHKKLP